MLLLGIVLTVGFYEGRRLVRNTQQALTQIREGPPASAAAGSPDEQSEEPTRTRTKAKTGRGRKVRSARSGEQLTLSERRPSINRLSHRDVDGTPNQLRVPLSPRRLPVRDLGLDLGQAPLFPRAPEENEDTGEPLPADP